MAGVKGGDVSGYIERGERGIGNTQTRRVMVVLILIYGISNPNFELSE